MALIQAVSYTYTSGSPYVNTYGSNNTAGNMLLAQFNGVGTGPVTIADSNGNTSNWIQIFAGSPVSGQLFAIWVCYNCNAGANTVTVTAANCPTLAGVTLGEFSGGLNALDSNSNTVFNSTAGYSNTTVPFTTQYSIETLIGFFICPVGYLSVGSPFTFGAGINYAGITYNGWSYYFSTSTGSASTIATASNNSGTVYGMLLGFYQQAAPGGGPNLRMLMGMGT